MSSEAAGGSTRVTPGGSSHGQAMSAHMVVGLRRSYLWRRRHENEIYTWETGREETKKKRPLGCRREAHLHNVSVAASLCGALACGSGSEVLWAARPLAQPVSRVECAPEQNPEATR